MTEDKRTCAECKYCDFSGSEFPCSECTSNTDYFETKVSRWIPCSERLPDDFTNVLTEYEWGGCTVAFFSSKVKKWFADSGHYDVEDIIAWMPLPEPYEKEGVKR